MKKILIIILSIFVSFCVDAQTSMRFRESSDLSLSGMPGACTKIDGDYLYCATVTPGRSSGIYKIDLKNEISTKITDVAGGQSLLFTSFEKMGNKFVAMALDLSNYHHNMFIFDNNFNILYRFNYTFHNINSFSKIIKIDNEIFGITQQMDADVEDSVVFKFDLENNNISDVDLSSLDKNKYSILYDFYNLTAAHGNDVMILFEKYKDGYFINYQNLDENYDRLIYYNNGIVNDAKYYDRIYGTFIPKNTYFYTTNEKTDMYYTSFEEIDLEGNTYSSIPIDILNNQRRFAFSNYSLGKYNSSYVMFSYDPGDEPDAFFDWSKYRLFFVDISNNITLNNDSSKGSVNVSKFNAFAGEEIEIQVNSIDEYKIDDIIVTDLENNIIDVVDNKFIMPDSDVKIDILYKGEVKGIEENPKTGIIDYTLIGLLLLLIAINVFSKAKKKSYFTKC